MGSSGDRRRGEPPVVRPLPEVVPARAVLTELARGFLLVHQSDPAHAARFARSFLKEQNGGPSAGPGFAPERVPMVRRGVAAALQDSRLE